tara:strand:- start:2818 stop:5112 length:2295 start_codon:yes stop_codon:yes gene_type:complete
MKKLLLILLLLPTLLLAQNSYIVIEAQYDSWGPQESEFYITDAQSDTIYHHQPTVQSEYLLDTLWVNAQPLTVILLDQFGDGWQDTGQQGYFRTWNNCQDTIVEFICSPTNYFATEIINFNLGPCLPNGPPPAPCFPAAVIINLDQYQSETSWEITDSLGLVVASGSGYGSQPDYATITVPVCLPEGDLNFTIFDSYGDGLQGSQWQGQDGSYFVKQCNDTLVYGTDPAFGNDTTHVFTIGECPPIYGCTDDDYVEWNPFADTDDGSCQTLKIFGCIDSTAFNYDSTANTMDLIPQCEFTLVLHDLMGNGWVGSHLSLDLPDTSFSFTHTGGFNDEYQFTIDAPDPAVFRFHISSQAALTTIECGFTLMNPEGDTLISVQPPFIQPLFPYAFVTNCGNTCIEKVFGCIDSLALNYDDEANTDDSSCYYVAGCMNPLYLEYDAAADFDNGSCSTLIVLGCMDSTALNYDPLANVEIPGSCIAVVEGCTQLLAFNYNPNANVDDGSCVPFIYGCTDQTMWNYDSLANTDDGSCIPFVYGCMDSTMFNFNPLANEPDSCIPFIYGCTDPSMFNYDASANTEDFSCIPYIYGCTDSTALNYDPLANTENGSCIEVVTGCMDPDAYNYNSLANVSDSACVYDAGCITGPGNPYWLNDGCYAWVIDVDVYCCENDWDASCQTMYDYCQLGWPTSIDETASSSIVVYPNPTSGILNIDTRLDISVEVYDINGKLMIEKNSKRIDFSDWPVGIYNLIIRKDELVITKRIIKQ